VGEVRRSGPIIIVQGEDGKKKIMRNKFKLKSDRIYIENDLSFEERKIWKKINRWAKQERSRGKEEKAG